MRAILRYARTAPFSAAVAVVVLVTGIAFTTPLARASRALAVGPVSVLERQLWWTPVTALFAAGSILDALVCAALALTVMAYVERLIGTRRTAAVSVGIGVLASLVGIGVHLLTILLGTPLLLLARPELTLDPAIGIAAVVMAGSAFAPILFRRRIRIIGMAIVLTFALFAGDQDSMYRVIAALLGLATGVLLRRRMRRTDPSAMPPVRTLARSSYGEVRTLVAAVVAVTGVGPVIVLLRGTVAGPLALVVSGYAQVNRNAGFDRCASYLHSTCDTVSVHGLARGLSAILLTLVPVALSLVAAWGLASGRRAAWILALAVNATSMVATGAAVGVVSLLTPREIERVGERFAVAALLAVALPLAVIVVLLFTRRRFQVRAERSAVRRASAISGIAFAVVLVLWGIGVAVSGASRLPLGARVIFGEFVNLVLPAGFSRTIPHTGPHPPGIMSLINEWAGVLFWVTVIVALVLVLRSADHGTSSESVRFRALLRREGGGTLGFLGTWEGTDHWFTPDGRGAVAYRRIGEVAIAVADPVCAPGREREVVDGFIAFCDRRGWRAVFYSIHDRTLAALRQRGWAAVSVGEETVVRLPGLELTGGAWKRVRQALAKADRLGLETEWTRWQDLTPSMARQIEILSEHWVAEKALPELGFTLGGMAELRDPDVALLLAVDADGVLQAVTSWMPSWRDGRLVGWTLDFMRRSDEAMPEIMVYLIASAALRMRDAGCEVMSLSGAPLATRPLAEGEEPAPSSVLSRLLAWLADILEPVYGFRSLFDFKQKFHPDLETIYMAYADAASLPAAGTAILRAYMPAASPRQTIELLRTLNPRAGSAPEPAGVR